MKLDIKTKSAYEAAFRLGTDYENHPEVNWDKIAIDNMLNKLLRGDKVLKSNQDYVLSIRKDTDRALDPDLEDCIKYRMRLRPITKLEIIKESDSDASESV